MQQVNDFHTSNGAPINHNPNPVHNRDELPGHTQMNGGHVHLGSKTEVPLSRAKSLCNAVSWVVLSLVFSAVLVFLARGPTYNGRPALRQGNSAPQTAVVIASYTGQGAYWIPDVPEGWYVYKYMMDYEDESLASKHGNMEVLPVPINQGREAMAYLTFVIDHYDNLPDYIVFLHGHERSWHQLHRIGDLIRALNLTALDAQGYTSLKCEAQLCEPRHKEKWHLSKGPYHFPCIGHGHHQRPLPAFWMYAFEGYKEHEKLPEYLGSPGGGQFAVSSAAVRQKPLEFWQRLRKPLEGDVLQFDELLRNMTKEMWGPPPKSDNCDIFANLRVDAYTVGLFFEKLWHVFFGMDHYVCPNIEHCRRNMFGNALHCGEAADIIGIFRDYKYTDCWADQKSLGRMVDHNEKFLRARRRANPDPQSNLV